MRPDRTLDHQAIAARIPHAGAMCLLDAVESWDTANILCRAISHRDVRNPLRCNGELSALCAIEYGAQAMAVHASLLGAAAGKPRSGYLAAIRDAEFLVSRLDDCADDLSVRAERLGGDEHGMQYAFSVHAAGAELARGRLTARIGDLPP